MSETQKGEGHECRKAVTEFLCEKGFVVLTYNGDDPSPGTPDLPYEAWAYEGPLNFDEAAPVVFGIGRTPEEAMDAMAVGGDLASVKAGAWLGRIDAALSPIPKKGEPDD